MRIHRRYSPAYFVTICLLGSAFAAMLGCVSFQIPLGPVPKSEKVQLKAPPAPFESFSSATTDAAWISGRTGNTISYLSECKRSHEKIEDVATELSLVIDKSKIVSLVSGSISSKATAEVTVVGQVDSQRVKMAIVVFKTDECLFSLTYGGLEEHFPTELKEFENFKLEFRTP
jgi:hypothetical protein